MGFRYQNRLVSVVLPYCFKLSLDCMDPFVAIYSDLVYRVLLGLIAQNFIITADYVVLLSLASLEL